MIYGEVITQLVEIANEHIGKILEERKRLSILTSVPLAEARFDLRDIFLAHKVLVEFLPSGPTDESTPIPDANLPRVREILTALRVLNGALFMQELGRFSVEIETQGGVVPKPWESVYRVPPPVDLASQRISKTFLRETKVPKPRSRSKDGEILLQRPLSIKNRRQLRLLGDAIVNIQDILDEFRHTDLKTSKMSDEAIHGS